MGGLARLTAEVWKAHVFMYKLYAQKNHENTYILYDFIKHVHLVRAGSEEKRAVDLLTCIFCMQM
jgi:hypothetical protein